MPNWTQIGREIEQATKEYGVDAYHVVRRAYLKKLSEHTGRTTILYSTAWLFAAPTGTDLAVSDVHGLMNAM